MISTLVLILFVFIPEELAELGLPLESLSARLRLPLAPVYAASLLTPALHLSQSTLHVPVPLEGGQQCTKCGESVVMRNTVSWRDVVGW